MSADVVQFACPQCHARLRVREGRGLNRELPCPDCRSLLHIASTTGPERVSAVLIRAATDGASDAPPAAAPAAENDASASHAIQRKSAALPRADQGPQPRPDYTFRTFVILAGVFALGLIAAAVRIIFAPSDTGEPATAAGGPQADGEAGSLVATADAASPADVDGAAQASPPAGAGDPQTASPTVESRLEGLGEWVEEFVVEEGRFPSGSVGAGDVPESRRFSWLALLAERSSRGGGPRAAWDRPWNEPVNAAFVRRRIVEFQNPLLTELTGQDGYPATHFVGLAGVGTEALQVDADRAVVGMFPPGRAIAPPEVRDGLAQTILACGVVDQLGSWAAAGRPTVRAFTRSPVVNGPDGFGTGQREGMIALMADGRAQFIANDVDPDVFRRLVAIADEPFDDVADPSIPSADGMSGGDDEDGSADAVASQSDEPSVEPKNEPHPAPARPIDVQAGLDQAIVKFDQPPCPLVDALASIAEIAGAPIRYDRTQLGEAAAGLDVRVELSLRQTTVRAVLHRLLAQGKLSFTVERDHIQIVPAGSDAED